MRAEMEKNRAELNEKILAVLTGSQRSQWQSMLGRPFKIVHPQGGPGFGGPGGPGDAAHRLRTGTLVVGAGGYASGPAVLAARLLRVKTMVMEQNHFPGATNRFFRDNLQADGRFKSAGALSEEWQGVLSGQPAAQVVHYCGSGISACHNILAMEIAGLSGSQLYSGSWSEWCADPARPIAY